MNLLTYRSALQCVLLSLSLLAHNASGQIACTTSNSVGFPSADETDRTYLNLASSAISIYRETNLTLGIPADATIFDVEIFDGDDQTTLPVNNTGDRDQPTATPYQYQLIADPLRDGSGTIVVSDTTDSDYFDNQWFQMVDDQSPDSAAQAFSGHYFYQIRMVYTGDMMNDSFFNTFKVRVCSDSATPVQLSTRELSFFPWGHFASGESNSSVGFVLYPYVPEGLASLDLIDGDADSQNDASNPGFFGAPFYLLLDPTGNRQILNLDPSGDGEFETTSYAPTGGVPQGSYIWQWGGLQINNTTLLEANVEIFSTPVTPFPVGEPPVIPPTPPTPGPDPAVGIPLNPLWALMLMTFALVLLVWRFRVKVG